MDRETAVILIQRLRANTEKIDKVIKEHLGVDTNFVVSVPPSKYNGVFPRLMEDGGNTTRLLTATPLLKLLFKRAFISISVVSYDVVTDTAIFRVFVNTEHAFDDELHFITVSEFSLCFTDGSVETT